MSNFKQLIGSASKHLKLNIHLKLYVNVVRCLLQYCKAWGFQFSHPTYFQALTMSNSNDAINLERLETIGDSFLKYAITTFLFCQNPNIHEGKLSHLRSKQVSNLNLYMLGQARGLGQAMVATKFEPHDNWLPPCYHVPRELEQALIQSGVPPSYWNMADLPQVQEMSQEEICRVLKEKCGSVVLDKQSSDKEIQSIPSFIPYNLLTQHSIPDKSIADCVEALIGAYLISCGPRGALLFMTWLGVEVLPKDAAGSPQSLQSPPSPLIVTPAISAPERHLHYLLDGYNKFEHMIGYVWRDKAYLLQAFSHASFYPNRLTDCYQRLEFLGDAVLDYLITRHLYQVSVLYYVKCLFHLKDVSFSGPPAPLPRRTDRPEVRAGQQHNLRVSGRQAPVPQVLQTPQPRTAECVRQVCQDPGGEWLESVRRMLPHRGG